MLFQKRGHFLRTTACALLAASVLASGVSRAQTPDAPIDQTEGPSKIGAYATCALQVFAAVTPIQIVGAVLFCGKLLLDEPSPKGGV